MRTSAGFFVGVHVRAVVRYGVAPKRPTRRVRPGSALRRAIASPVLAQLLVPGDRLVDVGGYDGSVVAGIGDGVRAVMVDVDGGGLEKASLSCLPVMGSALSLPLASGAADVVCCFDLLPCLPDADPSAVYAEAHRVLRPGGHLVVTEVDSDFSLPFTSQAESFARWDAVSARPTSEVFGAMEAAGFSILQQRRFHGALARLAYLVFFVWNKPRHGHRVKWRMWRLFGYFDSVVPLGAKATLFVAAAVPSDSDASLDLLSG
jgi:SAM-dependent methyltransferase